MWKVKCERSLTSPPSVGLCTSVLRWSLPRLVSLFPHSPYSSQLISDTRRRAHAACSDVCFRFFFASDGDAEKTSLRTSRKSTFSVENVSFYLARPNLFLHLYRRLDSVWQKRFQIFVEKCLIKIQNARNERRVQIFLSWLRVKKKQYIMQCSLNCKKGKQRSKFLFNYGGELLLNIYTQE